VAVRFFVCKRIKAAPLLKMLQAPQAELRRLMMLLHKRRTSFCRTIVCRAIF